MKIVPYILTAATMAATAAGCNELAWRGGDFSPAEAQGSGLVAPEPQALFLPVELASCFNRASHITYRPDPTGKDYWQSPAETQRRGIGDCEDIAIYLQHMLARRDRPSEVVFGLKHTHAENGHAWLELELEGVRYICEPGSGGFYRRDALPKLLYIPAEDIDVVREKVRRYHARTGVWVNSSYRDLILAEDQSQ